MGCTTCQALFRKLLQLEIMDLLPDKHLTPRGAMAHGRVGTEGASRGLACGAGSFLAPLLKHMNAPLTIPMTENQSLVHSFSLPLVAPVGILRGLLRAPPCSPLEAPSIKGTQAATVAVFGWSHSDFLLLICCHTLAEFESATKRICTLLML